MPLAYYSRAATQEFWTEHWGSQEPEALVGIARQSSLTDLVAAALPSAGQVLEAGCGLGQYVVLLRERGHAVVGAEKDEGALHRCRQAFPRAPVAVMDLSAAAIKPGALTGYISLGVVEHEEEGPQRILAEAHRTLAPGGSLILSVPYVNGIRWLVSPFVRFRQARRSEAGQKFHQYAFTRREVRKFLEAGGFRVLSLTPYDPRRILRKAFRSFVPSRSPLPQRGEDRPTKRPGTLEARARRLLYTSPLLRLLVLRPLGHMVLAVAEKR